MADPYTDPWKENSTILTLNWCIKGIIGKRRDLMIKSPLFTEGNMKWYLILYPQTSGDGHAAIYLHGETKEQMMNIKMVMFSLLKYSTSRLSKIIEASSTCEARSIGTKRFVGDLFSKENDGKFVYINDPYGTLFIECKILVNLKLKGHLMLPPPQIGSHLSSNLEQIFQSKQFSDVKIKCGNKVFDCAKILLAARSEVFKTIFEQEMIESETSEVVVEGVEPEVMAHVLKFIYTDKVDDEVLDGIAKEFFAAADKYELHGLMNICEMSMGEINKDNAMELLAMAKLYSLEQLKARILEFLKTADPRNPRL